MTNYTALIMLNLIHICALVAIFVKICDIAKTIKVMSRDDYQILLAYQELDEDYQND